LVAAELVVMQVLETDRTALLTLDLVAVAVVSR
jgi:hypothetical protein